MTNNTDNDFMNNVITEEDFITLGTMCCDIKKDFSIRWLNAIKKQGQTKADKYYPSYEKDFQKIQSDLDYIICAHYPLPIQMIKGIALTSVFYYGTKPEYDHYYDNYRNKDIKSNTELLLDYDNFINYTVKILGNYYAKNKDFKNFLKHSASLRKKIIKKSNYL